MIAIVEGRNGDPVGIDVDRIVYIERSDEGAFTEVYIADITESVRTVFVKPDVLELAAEVNRIRVTGYEAVREATPLFVGAPDEEPGQ